MPYNEQSKIKALAALRNLGPRTAKLLFEEGITDYETIEELGVIECYRRMRFRYSKEISMNFVYALEGALTKLDFRALDPDRKENLRQEAKAVGEVLEQS